MIDWTKPIETVPCERNPKPVPCQIDRYGDGTIKGVLILNDWIDSDGIECSDDPFAWRVFEETGKFKTLKGSVRNVSEHPLPEPTATWWARRWYDSASPDEREAMRVILAGEG